MLACLSPVLLAGLLSTISLDYHSLDYHTVTDASRFQTGLLEAQSCQEALALNARASANGIYALGLQYGIMAEKGPWSISLAPSVGAAYETKDFREHASRTNASFSLQLMGGYNRYRVAATLWHLSNGAPGGSNLGLDMVSLLGGVAF